MAKTIVVSNPNKEQFTTPEAFNSFTANNQIAGAGMIVPQVFREEGKILLTNSLGIAEARRTKASTEENPVFYTCSQVECDGLSFFVLYSSFIPVSTPVKVVVTKTIKDGAKGDNESEYNWGFSVEQVGISEAKAAATIPI